MMMIIILLIIIIIIIRITITIIIIRIKREAVSRTVSHHPSLTIKDYHSLILCYLKSLLQRCK